MQAINNMTSDERAVEAGQLSQPAEGNVGAYEPSDLTKLNQQGRLYVIADGLSGTGQVASEYAIKKVLNSFYTSDTADLQQRLLEAIQQANQDIYARNQANAPRRPIATTLMAALVHENKLFVANVGDSRAYVVWDQDIEQLGTGESQREEPKDSAEKAEEKPASPKALPSSTSPTGTQPMVIETDRPQSKPVIISQDESRTSSEPIPIDKLGNDAPEAFPPASPSNPTQPVKPVSDTAKHSEATQPVPAQGDDKEPPQDAPKDAQKEERAAANTIPNTPIAPLVPQALGLEDAVEPETFSRKLFPGDAVVLCNGGIAGFVRESEIAKAVTRHTPTEAMPRLTALAAQRGSRDNLIVSVAKVLSSPVGVRPPKPMPLPPAPRWEDWDTSPTPTTPPPDPSKPVSPRSDTAPIPTVAAGQTQQMSESRTKTGPINKAPESQTKTGPMAVNFGPSTQTGPMSSDTRPSTTVRPVGKREEFETETPFWLRWQSCAVLLLATACFLCALPVLAWQFVIPPETLAEAPVLGDIDSFIREQTAALGLDPESLAGEEPQVQIESPIATPTDEAAVVQSGDSPVATPDVVAENRSPIGTPTAESVVQAAPTQEPTPTPSPTLVIPTPEPVIGPTITIPLGCENRGRFRDDVTVPDGTEFAPADSFDKTWRVQNAGDCPWGPGYTIRFVSGDNLSSEQEYPITVVTDPNSEGNITVPMVAPSTSGEYRSVWQLHDLEGEPFGPEMYALINVSADAVPGAASASTGSVASGDAVYDFIANASSATWTAGPTDYTVQSGPISEELPVPLPQGLVAVGEAQIRGETTTRSNVLLTYPDELIGSIQGSYVVNEPLQPTDTLVATLGFIRLSILSDDGVTFEVVFTPDDGSGEQLVLLSRQVPYTESPVSEVIPLSDVTAGQTGTFTVRVLTGESTSQDWATWIDLRIVRP